MCALVPVFAAKKREKTATDGAPHFFITVIRNQYLALACIHNHRYPQDNPDLRQKE
ncbi:hypothetical protein ABU178_19680 [Pantoea osteomyelitidis]|uniref:Uncharacterized protein n=1 Tax=Pantoea osteomyelitidis TaxID=3230026 RepID=A0ABW7Q199_9GAMM